MHDFILAKQIAEKLRDIAWEKKLGKIKKVYLEIGEISLAHDGHEEHSEEINAENLEFALKSILKDEMFKGTRFFVEKTVGDSWKIVNIEV